MCNIPLDSKQVEGRESMASDEFYDAIDEMEADNITLIDKQKEEDTQQELWGSGSSHPVEGCISERVMKESSSTPRATEKRLWGVDEDEDMSDAPHALLKCQRVRVSFSGVCLSVALLPCIEQIPSPSAEGNSNNISFQEEEDEECFMPPLCSAVVDGGRVYESSPVCERSCSINKNDAAAAAVQSLSSMAGDNSIGELKHGGEPPPADAFYSHSASRSSLLAWKQVHIRVVHCIVCCCYDNIICLIVGSVLY